MADSFDGLMGEHAEDTRPDVPQTISRACHTSSLRLAVLTASNLFRAVQFQWVDALAVGDQATPDHNLSD
jgi:hypothetical protein